MVHLTLPSSGAGARQSISSLTIRQLCLILTSREELSQRFSTTKLALCSSGQSQIALVQGDSPAKCQRVGRLPVAQLPRPHSVAPQSQVGSTADSAVLQAPAGPFCHTPEPPAPMLILSGWLSAGSILRCPVPTINPLCLSPNPSSKED